MSSSSSSIEQKTVKCSNVLCKIQTQLNSKYFWIAKEIGNENKQRKILFCSQHCKDIANEHKRYLNQL